jgi:predicted transporter
MLVLHTRKFGKYITETVERCLSDLRLLLGLLYRLAASLLPPLSLQLNGLWCARDLRGTLTACERWP